MAIAGKNGTSANTPTNIVFGAGTIHKGLKNTGGKWNFTESVIGSTSGGSKFSAVPEITTIEVDGALVRAKGLDVKTGETVTMEINLAELSKDTIKTAIIGKEGVSNDENFDLIEPKADIEEGDYWENIAFVGKTVKGQEVIVIMDNALCTSGFEIEGKNKEGAVLKLTFTCTAALGGDLDVLPYHVYYPKAS